METKQERTSEQEARRHLLKLASYVPPAILGAMIVGPRIVLADDQDDGQGGTMNCGNGSIVVSAGGSACCPCVKGSPFHNQMACNKKKCELGNCSACGQLVFGSQVACKNATANCHSCTCAPVAGPGQSQFWMCQ